jgi:hypothetical protein
MVSFRSQSVNSAAKKTELHAKFDRQTQIMVGQSFKNRHVLTHIAHPTISLRIRQTAVALLCQRLRHFEYFQAVFVFIPHNTDLKKRVFEQFRTFCFVAARCPSRIDRIFDGSKDADLASEVMCLTPN